MAKLRRISVEGITFLWGLTTSFDPKADTVTCHLRIYRAGFKASPVVFVFTGLNFPQANSAFTADIHGINLNRPGQVRLLIGYALDHGWNADAVRTPTRFENGPAILTSLGFETTGLFPS